MYTILTMPRRRIKPVTLKQARKRIKSKNKGKKKSRVSVKETKRVRVKKYCVRNTRVDQDLRRQ